MTQDAFPHSLAEDKMIDKAFCLALEAYEKKIGEPLTDSERSRLTLDKWKLVRHKHGSHLKVLLPLC